jgi:uncharacterized protein (TIGR02594 family)
MIPSIPPWLIVALDEIGVIETPGPADTPRILQYHSATSLRATHDEVAWCSAFTNWCMREASIAGTNSAAARSWLTWGRGVKPPELGDVVVLSRGDNPAQGHVGFFIDHYGGMVQLLSGNVGNRVNVAWFKEANVLAYRRPA